MAQDYSRQGMGPDLYVFLELGLAYEKVCDPSLASQRQSIIFEFLLAPFREVDSSVWLCKVRCEFRASCHRVRSGVGKVLLRRHGWELEKS